MYRVVQTLDAQHRPDPREQCRMIDRLCQVIVGAGFEPGDDVLRIGPRGDEDHRDKRQARIGLQRLDRGDAVELRHHDVEQHEIGKPVADHRDGGFAVAGQDDFVAPAFEPELQNLQIVGHIVDDQDQRRIAHPDYPRDVASRYPAGTRGFSPAAGAG